MSKYIILPDVTCDLNEQIRAEFGMEDYIQGHIHFSDDRDFATTLDWSSISREDFYKALGNRKMQVNTAPASPEAYYEAFKKYAQAGVDILSISISSKISSTYNVAMAAAQRVLEEYPDRRIYCLDSYKMSGAMGLLVMHALELQRQGKTFDEVVQWLEDSKHRVHQMGPIDDLVVIARRGRITMGKAIMGNFAGVKPMGDCSRDGYVSVLVKIKGINKALDLTARYVDKMATKLEDQFVLICHTDRDAYAMKLKELIETQTSAKKVYVTDSFPACATNIGPGMVGVYFLGEEISEDMSVEKDAITALL